MPLTINDIEYYSLAELVDLVGVSRQTLWRWRKEGRVPLGRRFRQRQILFTVAEMKEVERIANLLELVEPAGARTESGRRASRQRRSTRQGTE